MMGARLSFFSPFFPTSLFSPVPQRFSRYFAVGAGSTSIAVFPFGLSCMCRMLASSAFAFSFSRPGAFLTPVVTTFRLVVPFLNSSMVAF